MKRGWITWNRAEIPPSTFETRQKRLRKWIQDKDLAAVVVYTDVWRSNHARFLTNFMPYWNRSLLVIPQDLSPILICALSPRVYPWIRSVSTLEEIRPSGDPAKTLLQLCKEKKWSRIGFLDLPQVPYGVYTQLRQKEVEMVDVPARDALGVPVDDHELQVRRYAIAMARDILGKELTTPLPISDNELTGRLEREFRRAGAEDLVVLTTDGRTPPSPPSGATLSDGFSVAIALEYRGHWVRLVRSRSRFLTADAMQSHFRDATSDFMTWGDGKIRIENLSGPYPYEEQVASDVIRGSILSIDTELSANGGTLFYGDTCWFSERGVELL